MGEIVQDNWHFETPAVDVYGKNIGNFGERSICLVLAGLFVLDLMFRCLCNDGNCAVVQRWLSKEGRDAIIISTD